MQVDVSPAATVTEHFEYTFIPENKYFAAARKVK
jgi:hypothetical protein